MRWRVLPTALLLLSVVACASAPAPTAQDAGSASAPVEAAPAASAVTRPAPTAAIRQQIRIMAVGDIMLGTDYPIDRLSPADHPGILAGVAALLDDADLTFGNLEGVMMDGGQPFKRCADPSVCYLFRSPTRLAAQLRAAGFDVMSLANNHARDFGEEGREATMATLDSLGIAHTGRDGTVASLTVDDLRVAFIAFAPNPGSWDLLDVVAAVAAVRRLDAEHDLVVVSFHGGAEGLDALHLPVGGESYYGEDRGDLRRFSHAVIDAGADLVIGHGPHVPRAVEAYRGRVIAYSLGNFATNWGISISGVKGYAPILDLTLTRAGDLVEGRIISALQQRPDGVSLDPEQRAARLIADLSAEDIPGSGISIDADGRMRARAVTP